MSTLAPWSARPITTTGHRRLAELGGMPVAHAERDEDQPVREPALEVAHDRELLVEVAAGRVQHEPPAARTDDLLDRRDHRRVDGFATSGIAKAIWPVRRERSDRAAAFGT